MCGTCVRQDRPPPKKTYLICLANEDSFNAWPLKTGPIGCSETTLSALRNIPAERISQAGGPLRRISHPPPFIRMAGLRKTRKTSVRLFPSKYKANRRRVSVPRWIGYDELQWGRSVSPCRVLYSLWGVGVEVNYQRGGSSNPSKDIVPSPGRILFLPHTNLVFCVSGLMYLQG
jgi:hypothetical protein